MITEDQLEQLAIQWFQDTGWNYVHGAVIAPEAEPNGPSPRPSPSGRGRNAAEREALRTLTPALSQGEKEEDGRLAARLRDAMPGQVLDLVTKPEHPIGRPFRAWNAVGDGTQGVALGYRMMPRWGGRRIRP